MSPETINLIIGGSISLASICLTSIVTLLALVVNNFFQNRLAQQNRKWALEDRQSNRRFEVVGIRIKEARDYLDAYHALVRRLEKFTRHLINRAGNNEILDKFQMDFVFDELPALLDGMSKKRAGISVLNDAELRDLEGELGAILRQEGHDMLDTVKRLQDKDTFDRENERHRVNKIYGRAYGFIALLHERLDELAQTMPQ